MLAVIGLGLAASGCAQSMSEFAQTPPPATMTPAVYSDVGPLPQVGGAPATVASVPPAASGAPIALVPQTHTAARTADADLPPLPPPPSGNTDLKRPPQQPDGKLLTPDEKARVIAELEALAKSQTARQGKAKKAADCGKRDTQAWPAHCWCK